jgi:hypothetical protein
VLVFAREVFVCKCPTEVPSVDPAGLVFRRGAAADLDLLDRAHHGEEDAVQMRARLARGDYWMIGERDGTVVTYTWLSRAPLATYPSLPGCEIRLRADTGYGYDAWTPPELRGQGLRRVAFSRELEILRREWGLLWEASFFVKHQLEGATRSLALVGIDVVPLWRIWLKSDRTLGAEPLSDDDAAVPAFSF